MGEPQAAPDLFWGAPDLFWGAPGSPCPGPAQPPCSQPSVSPSAELSWERFSFPHGFAITGSRSPWPGWVEQGHRELLVPGNNPCHSAWMSRGQSCTPAPMADIATRLLVEEKANPALPAAAATPVHSHLLKRKAAQALMAARLYPWHL